VGLPEPLQGRAICLPGSGQYQQGPAQPSRHLQARREGGTGLGCGRVGREGTEQGNITRSLPVAASSPMTPPLPACLWLWVACLSSRSGAFHPEVEDEILAALRATYSAEGYPTPAMRAAGMLCGCSYGWTDPCRSEFKQASSS
jgi:hypothetical protein